MTTPSTSTCTITGYIYNNDGSPLVGALVAEQPVYINAQGNSLIGNNIVSVNTDENGFFSLTCVGGVVAKIVVPDIGAVLQGTLPSSGTITLQNLFAQNPNTTVSSFPPQGNLNMGGYTFTNLVGASQVGEPIVYGLGLSNAAVFTNSGTYQPPANATVVHVRAYGAGGGGGGGNSGATHGGGGGGGPQIVDVDLLPANGLITVNIGIGGVGGAATADGTDGGSTTVTQTAAAEIVTALGGSKGTGGGGGNGNGGAGGTGGTPFAGAGYLIAEKDGAAGANGTNGAGGAGAGLGQIGGNGGNPSGGVGLAGANGLVLIWSN